MDLFPEITNVNTLNEGLLKLVRSTDTKIVFIIDEWDSLIREGMDDRYPSDKKTERPVSSL